MTNAIIRNPLFTEFDQLFSQYVNQTQAPISRNTALNYRILSEDNAAVAEIEVPGVEPSDVKVKIEGRSLSVETPRGNAYVTIGQRLSADDATATIKNGLLTIRIPKRDARIVEVKVSEM
jgi:HSP20 family molecular chaperone IbpA